jgi:hypothetical protein
MKACGENVLKPFAPGTSHRVPSWNQMVSKTFTFKLARVTFQRRIDIEPALEARFFARIRRTSPRDFSPPPRQVGRSHGMLFASFLRLWKCVPSEPRVTKVYVFLADATHADATRTYLRDPESWIGRGWEAVTRGFRGQKHRTALRQFFASGGLAVTGVNKY